MKNKTNINKYNKEHIEDLFNHATIIIAKILGNNNKVTFNQAVAFNDDDTFHHGYIEVILENVTNEFVLTTSSIHDFQMKTSMLSHLQMKSIEKGIPLYEAYEEMKDDDFVMIIFNDVESLRYILDEINLKNNDLPYQPVLSDLNNETIH